MLVLTERRPKTKSLDPFLPLVQWSETEQKKNPFCLCKGKLLTFWIWGGGYGLLHVSFLSPIQETCPIYLLAVKLRSLHQPYKLLFKEALNTSETIFLSCLQ